MSRSQFHSIKLFILTHAWLNLWDERMTTGRINQIAIFDWRVEKIHKNILHSPRTLCARGACVTTARKMLFRAEMWTNAFYTFRPPQLPIASLLRDARNRAAICLRLSAIHFSAVHRKGNESMMRNQSPTFTEAALLCGVNRRLRALF